MDYKLLTKNNIYRSAIFSLLFLGVYSAYGQSKIQTQKIKEEYRSSKIHSFTTELQRDFATNKSKILSLAKANGWKITETLPNGNYVELQDVGPDGAPIYYTTFSDHVSKVSRANTLYDNGLLNLGINGEGMQVGVWDAGVALTTHQEFDVRATVADGASELSPHATMIMGTLIASGIKEKAKGVAYKASATTNDWKRDIIEVSEAAANGLLLSNHSYGIKTDRVPDWYFGSYIRVSQDWDNLMYQAPYYLMVTAAGNAQRSRDNDAPIHGTTANGFDLLLGFATSKNGITVAGADTEIDGKGSLLKASVAGYSSFGPIDDGRIKPDIAGGGTNIYSTNSVDNKSYNTSTGTSMATSGVTGSMLLLQQYHERLYQTFMKAATLKGVVLHSADDIDAPGPDYKMGWGIMNSKRAAEIMVNKDYRTLISEETLAEGETYTITVNTDGTEPLMASISWTDPASGYTNKGVLNDVTPALVNDLDIRITKDGKTYYPWKLNAANASAAANKGDNRVDPFEKVEVEDASGEYTITVTHKGALKNKIQNFSIIVSGIAVTQCNTEVPYGVVLSEPTDTSVIFEWEPMMDAFFEVQYKDVNATEWNTEYTSENKIVLENLVKENDYEFRLRTFCTENIMSDYTSTIRFTFLGKETELEEQQNYTILMDTPALNFSVYPNPAVERIVLENGNLSKYAKYSIVSTMGVTIKEGNAHDAEIDVTQLSSGLYILVVQDLNGSKSTKFYKS